MEFRTKLDFSSRQVKQNERTFANISGGTTFGVTFSALTTGPDLTTSGITSSATSVVSTFSGNTGTTVFTWYDSRMNLANTYISAITNTTSGLTQTTGQIYTGNTTGSTDGNGYYLFEPNSKQFNNFSLSIHATQPLSPFVKPFQLDDVFLHNLIFKKNDFFKFAIVRNPFSRLLSCYLDKVVNHKNLLLFERQQILKIIGKNILDSEYDISFDEFIDAIKVQKPYDMNHHWRTQSSQLFIPIVKYDYIGKFENFQSFMSKVNSNIKGVSFEGTKINHHETLATSLLKKYYTSENLKKTIDIYIDDFINFNYLPAIN
jgi:hypothetical protein